MKNSQMMRPMMREYLQTTTESQDAKTTNSDRPPLQNYQQNVIY
jgi:hypothetical protein